MQLKDILRYAGIMANIPDVVRYVDEECKLSEEWADGMEYEDQWIVEEWWNDGFYDDGEEISLLTYEKINTLVNFTNLVINELSCTYVPMVIEEQITFSNGKAFYNDFGKKVVKILEVKDFSGVEFDFTNKIEYLQVPFSANQTLTVKYQYSPDNYSIMDKIGYTEKDISARVIAYGVVSEYFINQGNFEQAVIYHKRYVDEIALLTLPKNSKIKQRSWR